MTADSLIKDLKKRQFHPVYLLHGPEPYYIDQITDYFEDHVLDESERSFNLTILYGKETEFKTVVDNARRFPMMSEYQLVILKEAQSMKELAELETYVKNPSPSTILVICYKHGNIDGRTSFAKLLKTQAIVFESKKVYDNQMPAWITSHLESKGFQIGPAEAALISDYLGAELSKVANEIEKLALNLPQGHKVNKDDIEKYIGISKDFNVFELQDALASRNKEKAYRIIQYFMSNPKNNPLIVVVATLFSYFSKIYLMQFLRNSPDREVQKSLGLSNTFFVKNYRAAAQAFSKSQTEKIIHLLRIYDLKSKGVGRDSFTEQAMMQELIYKILSA
ncbi:MAG: DNA polymerase III subunit delta [Saprospiraceae bacterium]|nr:DNA polymerase III subunit delta [Saprospiraceae bacterium]